MAAPASGPPAGLASGAGALAACCTVHLLVIAGAVGSLSGYAVGGLAVGAGVAAAAVVWLAVVWLRRRRLGAAAACHSDQPAP